MKVWTIDIHGCMEMLRFFQRADSGCMFSNCMLSRELQSFLINSPMKIHIRICLCKMRILSCVNIYMLILLCWKIKILFIIIKKKSMYFFSHEKYLFFFLFIEKLSTPINKRADEKFKILSLYHISLLWHKCSFNYKPYLLHQKITVNGCNKNVLTTFLIRRCLITAIGC